MRALAQELWNRKGRLREDEERGFSSSRRCLEFWGLCKPRSEASDPRPSYHLPFPCSETKRKIKAITPTIRLENASLD